MVTLYVKDTKLKTVYSNDFIKEVYGRHTGIFDPLIKISKTKLGKPFFYNEPNFHFNLSHTQNIIICGVSTAQIGVDIERLRKFNPKIVKSCFSLNEQNYILKDGSNLDQKFTEIWTMKEAYVKFLGIGLNMNFASFDVVEQIKVKSFNINGYITAIYIGSCCRDFTVKVIYL